MNILDIRWTTVDRSQVIGGTDMSVLLGVNKWKTRPELFEEKLGNRTVEVNDAMYWGIMAEPMVARHIESKLDNDDHILFDPENPWLETNGHQVEHKDYPFITGSPDRLIMDKSNGEIIEGIEIKTAFEWTLKSWKKEVPKYYEVQCQHYMMVTGMETWKICALIGNRTYLEFDLEADLMLQDEMIEEAIKFNDELGVLIDKQAEEGLKKYDELLSGNKEEQCITMGKAKV